MEQRQGYSGDVLQPQRRTRYPNQQQQQGQKDEGHHTRCQIENHMCCGHAARVGCCATTAMAAVEVVPTFAPMTMAAAASMANTPPVAAVSVIAMDALDDWVTTVMTNANRKYRPTPSGESGES